LSQFINNNYKPTYCTRFQASTMKQMRTAFFWVIAQWVVVIPYQHSGTKRMSWNIGKYWIPDPCRWDWQVVLKCR